MSAAAPRRPRTKSGPKDGSKAGSGPGRHGRPHAQPPRRSPALAAICLVGAALMFCGCAAVGWWAGGNVAYASRLAGTPGTFTVRTCVSSGQGRNESYSCVGSFRADDGRVLRTGPLGNGEHDPGDRIPVQVSGSDLHSVGVAPAAGWCFVLAFALGVLTSAVQVLVVGVEAASPALAVRLRRSHWRPRIRSAVSLLGKGAGGAAGAAAVVFVVGKIVS
ncbi:hypothetical protein [Kitasatospora viridis]|uniref:Uncharacterized protein n=1 Tax=Kitasatospora viridis TaxID=281105 RepID=A0A561UPW8_9ACTN|nr:hypothetical protein [Kitasatospora viridis]TWG01418.1 hypothetical protein FHX73_115311 [Kitasatospora viridis]